MIRTLKSLFMMLLIIGAAACSDDKNELPAFAVDLEMENTEGRIVLDKEAGSEATFTITANVRWQIEYDAALFSVTPTEATNGRTEVKIIAKETNPETHYRKLGNLIIHCAAATQDVPIEVYQRSDEAEQTVLIYMPGTNLGGYYIHNIELCRKAIAEHGLDNGRLIVCHQPSGHTSAAMTELYFDEQKQDCEAIQLKSYDNFEAGDEESVARMMNDMAELAPAKRYGLIIGSHGKAWVPAELGLTSRALSLKGGMSEEEFWRPMAGAKPTRAFGDTNHSLEITELSHLITGLKFRFDYLIFDACFMSNIETLYDLRTNFDYIVGSPCEIMAAGFPYDTIIPQIFSGTTPKDFLPKVCYEYWDFYANNWHKDPMNEPSGCIAMTVTKELDGLAQAMRRVTAAKQQEYDLAALQTYEGLPQHVFFDLGHFVELSCADQAARDAFNQQMERTFPMDCRLHTETFFSAYNGPDNPIHHYTGVTVSEPCSRYKVENQATAWYRATH